MDWGKVVRRLWLRDSFFAGGWSFLGTDVRLVKLYYFAGLAGLMGWGWRVVARGRRESAVFESARAPIACLVLCASFTAALGYHMVQSKLAWGAPTTTPWYACPALPWFLMIVAGGGLSWPIGRLPRGRAGAPDGRLPGGRVLSPSGTGWSRPIREGASGLEALRRLSQLQPAAFGTATLLAAAIGSWVLLAAAASSSASPTTRMRSGANPMRHRPIPPLIGSLRRPRPLTRRTFPGSPR
jgi:hypothetical protein